MKKQEVQMSFIFENPNSQETFENQLQKILIEKLLSQDGKEVTTK